MYNLLAILQSIMQSYSCLSIQQLFDNNLCINIFLISNMQVVKEILKRDFPKINKAKEQIFLKGDSFFNGSSLQFGKKQGKCSQKQMFLYVTVSHPKKLQLQKDLLYRKQKNSKGEQNQHINNYIESLICVTSSNQTLDNIIQLDQRAQKEINQRQIIGFFFKIPFEETGTQQVINQVSLFLSICELFHSHVGLVMSIHEVPDYKNFGKLIEMSRKDFQQDDDELLSCSNYCRLFQAMPYKITNQDIALLADIQTDYWGQTIKIQQGNDGLLFWFLFNKHPILIDQQKTDNYHNDHRPVKVSTDQKAFAQKCGLKLSEQKHGHIIFKSKNAIKQPLQDLCLTIVIINVKKMKYCKSLDQIFGGIMEREMKKLSQSRAKTREFSMCEKVGNEIDRLSELLVEVQPQSEVQIEYLVKEDEKRKEAQLLSQNISRRLFLQSKQ